MAVHQIITPTDVQLQRWLVLGQKGAGCDETPADRCDPVRELREGLLEKVAMGITLGRWGEERDWRSRQREEGAGAKHTASSRVRDGGRGCCRE